MCAGIAGLQKFAIIMRGLPGSGKTHIAKKLKDLEAELGGENPRIHALDDYFMTVRPRMYRARHVLSAHRMRKVVPAQTAHPSQCHHSFFAYLEPAYPLRNIVLRNIAGLN